MSLWEQMTPRVWWPRGMVGRINIVNYYASLHKEVVGFMVSEDFLKSYSPIYVKSNDLRAWPIWTAGAWLA